MIKLFQKIPLSIICVVPVVIVIGVSNAQSISENWKLNFAGFIIADTPTELYARQKNHSLPERSQLLQVRNISNISPPSCFRPDWVGSLDNKNHVYGIFKHQGWLYVPFVAGRDTTHILQIHPIDTPQTTQDVNILQELDGRPIQTLRAADTKGDSLVLWTKDRRLVLKDKIWKAMPNPEPELYRHHGGGRTGTEAGVEFVKFWVPLAWVWQWIAEPSPGHRLLIWGEHISIHSHRGPDRPGITVLTTQTGKEARGPAGEGPLFYPLPQPSPQQYKKLMSETQVDYGYGSRYPHSLEANFGAYDFHKGNIWFGLTFYDSEGISGIGGYGRFDPGTGEYEIKWGEPAADLSVSALYHAGDALWMGLIGRHESVSLRQGGIARIDLSDSSVRRYQVPGAVDVLCPVENTLWIGTREGLFRMKDDTVESVWPLRDGVK